MAAVVAGTGLVDRLLDSTRSAVPAAQRARYAALFRDPAHVQGAMGFMAAADLPKLAIEARALAVPVTFVLGSYDHWVPERPLREVIARTFPDASVLRWDGGHLLHEEHPAAAAALLKAVLQQWGD